MNERSHYIRLGKKPSNRGQRKAHKEHKYDSYWSQPGDKLSKRRANKKIRRSFCINGNHFKKVSDTGFEWS